MGRTGRRAEAHDLLAPIYRWFTEGFDIADLKEAKHCSISRLEYRRLIRLILTIYGQSLLEYVLNTTVSVAQAKSRFAALVARAEAGERIIVTRSGRAVACLGPLPRRQPIKYGELSGVFLSEDLTIPEEVIRDFEPGK